MAPEADNKDEEFDKVGGSKVTQASFRGMSSHGTREVGALRRNAAEGPQVGLEDK